MRSPLRNLVFTVLCLLPQTAQAIPLTGPAGGGLPFDNLQPSLVLNEFMGLGGAFPIPNGSAYSLGTVRMFAGHFEPSQAPFARGQTLTLDVNSSALFSLLGIQYGGDGATNFALPNMTGRVAVGASNPLSPGAQRGTETETLTVDQLPAHHHTLPPSADVTGDTGGGQPVNNVQPSLELNYIIATNGIYPSGGGSELNGTIIGQVAQFAGNFAPAGFKIADGSLLAIEDHTALFTLIGTIYGGDGVTNFALPDLRGRTAIGAGQGPGLDEIALGETGGGETNTLSVNQMPTHDHVVPPGPDSTGDTGGGQPVNNMQPYLGMNYFITVEGQFPEIGEGEGFLPNKPVIGEIIMFAGNFPLGGFAPAEGQLLSIASNTALFSILGTTYGGDGETTFALPDLRGRAVMGAGGDWLLGQRVGSPDLTLAESQMPRHFHTLGGQDGGPENVPEPGTMALIAAGLLGLMLITSRQQALRRIRN
jgi:microcystin-dependent protein